MPLYKLTNYGLSCGAVLQLTKSNLTVHFSGAIPELIKNNIYFVNIVYNK